MPDSGPRDNKLKLVLIGLAIFTVVCLLVGLFGWSHIEGLFSEQAGGLKLPR